jgi:hypothetical protein
VIKKNELIKRRKKSSVSETKSDAAQLIEKKDTVEDLPSQVSSQPEDPQSGQVPVEKEYSDVHSSPKRRKINNLDNRRPAVVLYNKNTVCESLPSLRLSEHFDCFSEGLNLPPTSDFFSNRIDPFKTWCYFDLHGSCRDSNCTNQHKSDFLLSNEEKLLDILSFNPTLASVTHEDIAKNPIQSREKLLNFIHNYQKSQPNASFEEVARQLLKLVRHSLKDTNFLTAEGGIKMFPIERNSKISESDVKPFMYSFNGENVAKEKKSTKKS